MGWHGLLVEASPPNCQKLRRRRTESPRVHIECSALCKQSGRRAFSSTMGGCCGRISSKGSSYVQCRRTQDVLKQYNITHVDFWSLDVEGHEESVLQWLDWSVPVYVFLIEGVTPSIRRLFQMHGYIHHQMNSRSKLNEIWLHPTFYYHDVHYGTRIQPFSQTETFDIV